MFLNKFENYIAENDDEEFSFKQNQLQSKELLVEISDLMVKLNKKGDYANFYNSFFYCTSCVYDIESMI